MLQSFSVWRLLKMRTIVAEPHHFYAVPADKNMNAAPASDPTLL
jgi:hypothetical protein